MRHADDIDAGTNRQLRRAAREAQFLSGLDASAFGKDQHPAALRQPLGAVLDDLLQRRTGIVAVDRYRAHHRQSPAKKRNPQQFTLEQDAQLRKQRGQKDRLPTCLLYTSPSPRDRTRSRMPSSA